MRGVGAAQGERLCGPGATSPEEKRKGTKLGALTCVPAGCLLPWPFLWGSEGAQR